MATLIHSIDGKCHIKQLKAGESHKFYLTNHTWPISHHITPLVTNALRGGHTDTQAHTQRRADQRNFKKPGVRTHARLV